MGRSGDAEPINIKHGFQKQTKTWASTNIIIRRRDTDWVCLSDTVNNWPEFILIQPNGEKQLTSNPFMTAKVIQGIAGEVKAVKSLRNGDILVHCAMAISWCTAQWRYPGALRNGDILVHCAMAISWCTAQWRYPGALRNGDILVHCALRSHALNLLKLKAFAGIPCKVSPHRSLNSSKGIIRDRERCLQSMTE